MTDKDGTSQIAEASVPVHVKAPFYAHPVLLWSVYPLLLLLGIGIPWMFWRRSERSRIEAAHEKRFNDMNMSFFSNISHEFRTPLTMIVGPVRMLQQTSDDPEQVALLKIVHRNIDRMLRLVNQLMDFNKLEQDALRLKVQCADLVSQLNKMSETFIYNARCKQMEFCTSGLEGTLLMLLDADKIEKIVTNLVSNTLKFAPPQSGRIELRLDTIGRREEPSSQSCCRRTMPSIRPRSGCNPTPCRRPRLRRCRPSSPNRRQRSIRRTSGRRFSSWTTMPKS